jgi:hypothetical protein
VTVRTLSRLGTNRFNLYRAVQLLGNAASLGLVFLILSGLYESWALPFSVLLSVPIAIFVIPMLFVLMERLATRPGTQPRVATGPAPSEGSA